MKRIRSPIFLLLFSLISSLGFAQYAGGDGYGSISLLLSQTSCSTPVYPSIFTGGDETCAAAFQLQQASCAAAALPSVFAGGDENSASSMLLSQVSCAAPVYPSIFSGGIESSENSMDISQVSCAAPVYPSIFTGGSDDGFSGTPAIQVACITPPDPGIYAGGNSNVTTGVTFLTACAPYAEFEADTQFVCEGDTVFFTDLSLGAPTAWSWSFEGGTPLGSSFQNPFVIYNTAGTYQVQLQISAPTGNSTELKTDYIVVGARPSATIAASGPTSFCGGDSVLLTVNPVYPSYSWSSGQTTQSVYASVSGNYFSVVTAANGCTANTDTIPVNVLSNPVPLVTTSGQTTLCNADTLTLTSSPGTSYLWLPGSETTQILEVTASGTYYVSVSYPNGCSNVSAPVNAVFGTTPATPVITPSGPLTFCNGDSVVLTSSPASSYLWNPGLVISQSITVKNSGTYYVETGNGTGCTAMSLPVTVTVLPNTPAPVITASGPLTFCTG
ncbi:MAG: PKD domain-containing protein, partial [Bacteroidales bacterium]|nr:PKD domain-containing protein [Bacteroidales bacterium]